MEAQHSNIILHNTKRAAENIIDCSTRSHFKKSPLPISRSSSMPLDSIIDQNFLNDSAMNGEHDALLNASDDSAAFEVSMNDTEISKSLPHLGHDDHSTAEPTAFFGLYDMENRGDPSTASETTSFESLAAEPISDSPTPLALANGEPSTISFQTAATIFTRVKSLVTNATNQIFARNWIPADPAESCMFPEEHFAQYELHFDTVATDESICVAQANDELSSRLSKSDYHLVYTRNERLRYSLFRSPDKKEIIDLARRCSECVILFGLVKTENRRAKDEIERLFKTIKSKPLYQMVHVAIHCNQEELFESPGLPEGSTPRIFETFCISEGLYPIHMAIARDNYEFVKKLIEAGVNMLVIDRRGNNVLHHAAVTSVKMLELIWEKSPDTRQLLNNVNDDGHTPILVAIRAANPRITSCFVGFGAQFVVRGAPRSPLFEAMATRNSASVIDIIVNAMPDAMNERDSLGNTALHVATYKEPLAALFAKKEKLNVDLDATNRSGETALHVYLVKEQALSLVMTIISYGCNINAADNHGNTALHKAVAIPNIQPVILQFLLAVGADPDLTNDRGETPRHIAARQQNIEALRALITIGAKRCSSNQKGCVSDCAYYKNGIPAYAIENDEIFLKEKVIGSRPEDYEMPQFNQIEHKIYDDRMAKKYEENPRRLVNLLSLDGGGIRGLVVIQTLLAVEDMLGEPVAPYFDWVAGTSTGSLIAASLAKGITLRDLQLSYLRFKDRVFEGFTPPFDTLLLEQFIKEQIGEEPLADIKHPRLMISAVNAERFPVKLTFMRNYSNETDDETPKDLPLWVALRRSTSAPIFFNPADAYIDGGIIANNPTLDLLMEFQNFNLPAEMNMTKSQNDAVELNCVLSLGTGQIPTTPMMKLQLSSTSPFQSMVALKNLTMIFVDQATASEGAPVARSRAFCQAMRVPFFRLSSPLSSAVQLCTTNDLEVAQMMWDAVKFCHLNTEYIRRLCNVLKRDPNHTKRGDPFEGSLSDYLSPRPQSNSTS